ncbi:cucumber peeling cupredoxin-like [Impatiens glandulifera]|uniref:cucumber peeling cupredoxin-like n=1 Tax=Impatiens glandulifera TaxID=253017 RepID=UPI001FB0E947|nr:cucumber peeling cupredoxin-like [Impatiens glandulifera]
MAGKFLIVALAVVALVVQSATGATYTVRDNLGWGVPGGGATDYATWASTITFRVGDILVFNFGTGSHDVASVTKVNFDLCNTNGPITLQTVGPANVTLNATGEFNFICTFGRHCLNGQKLSINVTTASTTPPATPSPPPAPSTPSPTPAPATPSPPPAPATPSPSPAPSTPSPPPAPATPSPPPSPDTSSPPPTPGSPEIPTSPPPTTPTPPTNAIPPPPPSSAPPRSLAVFGYVCTLLAFVMGLTL